MRAIGNAISVVVALIMWMVIAFVCLVCIGWGVHAVIDVLKIGWNL